MSKDSFAMGSMPQYRGRPVVWLLETLLRGNESAAPHKQKEMADHAYNALFDLAFEGKLSLQRERRMRRKK